MRTIVLRLLRTALELSGTDSRRQTGKIPTAATNTGYIETFVKFRTTAP